MGYGWGGLCWKAEYEVVVHLVLWEQFEVLGHFLFDVDICELSSMMMYIGRIHVLDPHNVYRHMYCVVCRVG